MEIIFNSFFKNKKVLITGHTGFKGAWLALWLHKLGANVSGIALSPDSNPSLFDLLNLEKEINHHICDIRDQLLVQDIFDEIDPDIVFHMAAQPLVLRSYKEPKYTYEVNVMGTLNLLECLRKSLSKKIFINITTDKCYENKEWIYGYREIDQLGGHDPYSSSKACSEILTSSYRNAFFNLNEYSKTHNVSIATVRAGNIIGGGDWSEYRLIPDCIQSLAKKKAILIRNKNSIRPWQHVFEPLRGYLLLALRMSQEPIQFSGAWNFGPRDDSIINVETLVNKAIKIWGNGEYILDSNHYRHESSLLKLDTSKSKYELGFNPILDIDKSMELTISWYKEFYYNKINIQSFSLKQIDDYEKLLE